jgi:uncharacterized protein
MLGSALLVGVIAGGVGMGGILLPPALVYVDGLDFHLAAATSMWAFLFPAAEGTFTYWRRRNVDWRMVAWVRAGIVPTAFVGAWANVAFPESVPIAVLALLMIVTGAVNLLRSPVEQVRHFEAPVSHRPRGPASSEAERMLWGMLWDMFSPPCDGADP